MNAFVKRGLTAAATTLAIALVACGSRVKQCNLLIEKVNHAGTVISTAGSKMGDMAKAVDTAKKDVESVQLSDDKLKGYQTDYAKMLEKIGQAANKAQAAQDKKDFAAAAAAAKDVMDASKEETGIVANINSYCQNGK
jgi:hypothetical protein